MLGMNNGEREHGSLVALRAWWDWQRLSRARFAVRANELTSLLDVVGAGAIGQETIIANADEALRKDVHEETADELGDLELRDFVGIVIRIVTPTKGNGLVVECDDAAIGDGDTVSIGSEIAEDVFGAAEGWLEMDVPIRLPGLRKKKIESGPIGSDRSR